MANNTFPCPFCDKKMGVGTELPAVEAPPKKRGAGEDLSDFESE